MNVIVRLQDDRIVIERGGKILGRHPACSMQELWEVIDTLGNGYAVREFTVINERTLSPWWTKGKP